MNVQDLSRLKIDRAAPPRGGMQRRRRRWAALAAIGVVLVTAAVVAFRITSRPAIETASVVLAYPSQAYAVLNATGYVVAQRKAAVSSKATGRLEWLGVQEGSRVKEGEVIARLESRDVTAALDQARANVQVAEANLRQGVAELDDAQAAFRRSAELLEKKFISAASHDAATARLNKARAAIGGLKAAIAAAQANRRAAEVTVGQTEIRAPFNGVILTKSANVGDNITPFSQAADTKGAVVTMADLETLEVEVDVAEGSIAQVAAGQPCEVQLEAFPELRLPCSVSRIVPTVDRTKATVLVKVRFDERDPRVLPDMSAKVTFLSQHALPAERQPVAATQAGAIAEREGQTYVFVVQDDRVRRRAVKLGRRIGELVELTGVKPGDKLALNPPPELDDGDRVKVAAK